MDGAAGRARLTRIITRRVRMIVTGSRLWEHPRSVNECLDYVCTVLARRVPANIALSNGKARYGLDPLASAWTKRRRERGWPVAEDPYPADWDHCEPGWCGPGHRVARPDGSTYCPMAGHRRNQLMVDQGALLCLAFIRDGSSGATDCVTRATKAGIYASVIDWRQRNSALDVVHSVDWESLLVAARS